VAITALEGDLSLGGFLTVLFGWQSNFVLLLLIAVVQFVAVARTLNESNVHRNPGATNPRQMFANFRRLLADRSYLGYLLTFSFSYSALFAFISASSFVLADRYGLTPQVYGICFGVVVAGYALGSLASGRLVRHRGSDYLLGRGAGLGAIAGLVMAVLEFSGVHSLTAILGPMFFCTVATGLVMPNAIARALAPYPEMAGSASAMMGFVQMTIAALVGIAVGHALSGGGQALAGAVAICTMLAPISYLALIRARRDT
jgi:DHA1 family bicyclomycin/chloramphenicol resistance-like MFS transporter